jgi:hypothetical protein
MKVSVINETAYRPKHLAPATGPTRLQMHTLRPGGNKPHWDCKPMGAMRVCPGGKEKGDLFEIPLVVDLSADYSRLWPYSSLFGLHWFE